MILKKKDYFATRYSLIPDLQLDFASIQGITKEKKFMNWLLSFEKEKKKEVFYRAKNYTLYCKQVSINCFFMSFAKELQETIGQKTDDGIQDTLINNYIMRLKRVKDNNMYHKFNFIFLNKQI